MSDDHVRCRGMGSGWTRSPPSAPPRAATLTDVSKWFSGFGSAVFAIVAIASGVITIAGWAVPSLRDWLGGQPALAWGICSVLSVFGGAGVVVLLGRLKERTGELAQQVASVRSLEKDCAGERARSSDLKSRLDGMHASLLGAEHEVARLEAAVADLELRLHPTEHDLDYFSTLMEYFGWESGVIDWLAEGFVPKRWSEDQVRPLYLFNDTWGHRYFDDEVVQSVYEEFRRATHSLGDWLASEGAYDDTNDPRISRILSGDRRHGGWPAYDKAIETALHLRDEVLRQRRELERVGRERGLKLPKDSRGRATTGN